ncbi:MAG: large subunit ribosomal protein L29 [Candidatus Marivariicella framensis]|jgi:large subunit ribosomal protein L29|tara:strand:+ start:252 stop:437 length:186 start_codon:yes stop_codon:yes gene_type:complete
MKQTEIEKLSAQDLIDKVEEFKKKLNDLRMTHTISPLENPIQIRDVRRTISRLLTAQNAKK